MKRQFLVVILVNLLLVQSAAGQATPLSVSKSIGRQLASNTSAIRAATNTLNQNIKRLASKVTGRSLKKGDYNGDGRIDDSDQTLAIFCKSQTEPVQLKVEGAKKLVRLSILAGPCPVFDKNRDGVITSVEMPDIEISTIATLAAATLAAKQIAAITKAQQAVTDSSDKLAKLEDARNLLAFGASPDSLDFNKNFVADTGDKLAAELCVNEDSSGGLDSPKVGRMPKTCIPLDTNSNGIVTKTEAANFESSAPPILKLEAPKEGASVAARTIRVAGFCAPQFDVNVGIGLAGQAQRIGGPVFEDSKLVQCNSGCFQASFIAEGLVPLRDITWFTPGCRAGSVGTFDTTLTLPSAAPSGDRQVQVSNRFAVGDVPIIRLVHFNIDTIRPAVVTDLTVYNQGVRRTTSDLASVQLQWTAPGDDGLEGQAQEYDLRYSKAPIDGTNFRQGIRISTESPHQGGYQFETVNLTSLELSTRYYFALSTIDDAGNWSAISNIASIVTGGVDVTKPGPVQDLTAYVGGSIGLPDGSPNTDVFLQWTTPGNDGFVGQAASYDMRYWRAELEGTGIAQSSYDTGAKVAVSLLHAGGYQYDSVLMHLSPGRYKFALKTTDDFGNVSDLSNTAAAELVIPDIIAPSRVTNLTAYIGGSVGLPNGDPNRDVLLQWTAPGDDGTIGQAAQYDLRYSTLPITNSNFASAISISMSAPHSAGHMFESRNLSLTSDSEYYFALKTRDEVNNWSSLSNVVHITLLPVSNVEGVTPGQTIRGERLHLKGKCNTDYPVVYRPNSTIMLSVIEEVGESGVLRTGCMPNGQTPKQGTYDFGPLVLIRKNNSCAAWQPCSASFIINQELNGAVIISKSISFKYASSDDGSLNYILPPVQNFQSQSVHDRSARLTWTASALDNNPLFGGIPAAYDIRYSTQPITSNNIAQAKKASGEPTPLLAGTAQSFSLTGLTPETTYYVSIQSQTDGLNPSARSAPSLVQFQTAPAQSSESIDPGVLPLVNSLPLQNINNLPMAADRDEHLLDEIAVGFPEDSNGQGLVKVFHLENDPQGGISVDQVDTINYRTITGDTSHRAFGRSVAIRGNTLIVGSINSENYGWFHVFVHQANGTWAHTQQTRLDTNHVAGKYVTSGFASALGLSEDGITLAVGNPSPDSAYIFYRSSPGVYGFSRQIIPPSNISVNGARFGASIAVSGRTVVVGAPNAFVRGVQTGRVFVYDVTNGSRYDTGDLKPSTPTANGGFGTTVAIQGDTIVVGSANADSLTYGYSPNCTAPFAPVGLADVFAKETLSVPLASGVSVSWNIAQTLFEPAADHDSCGASGFGTSVAMSNGRIAVGAPQAQHSNTSSNSGSIYLFKPDSDNMMGLSLNIDDATMSGINGGQNIVMFNGVITATLPVGGGAASSAVRTFKIH